MLVCLCLFGSALGPVCAEEAAVASTGADVAVVAAAPEASVLPAEAVLREAEAAVASPAEPAGEADGAGQDAAASEAAQDAAGAGGDESADAAAAEEAGQGAADASEGAAAGGADAPSEGVPEDDGDASAAETDPAGGSEAGEGAGEAPGDATAEPTEAPGAEPVSGLSAAELPEFNRGYACVIGGAIGYVSAAPGAEADVYLDGGVVYALSRRAASDTDRLECAFDDGAQERRCWLDASALRPMEQAEIQRFMEERLADGEARFLSEDATLVLDRPAWTGAPISVRAAEAPEAEEADSDAPAMLVGQTELVLGVGEKCVLDVSFSDGEAHELRFSVKNTRIAKVSAAGEVSAKKRGSTTVRIESEFGNEASVNVTVKKAPGKLNLTAARTTLGVGESLKLTATLSSGSASALRFTSSNPAVAAVDADGAVRAVAPGEAKITAQTFNGRKSSVTLRVAPAPTGVSLEAALVLGVGQQVNLAPRLGGGGAGACAFRCDDGNVLEVNAETGAIRALREGAATVTVETYNGFAASCAVTVKRAPSSVSLAQTSLTLGVGETVALPEVRLGAPGEDCMAGYTVQTSNKKVVSVGEQGALRALRTGSATITVTTHNGLKAQLKVSVKRAPGSVKLSAKELTLGVGEELALVATLPSKTAGSVRFESSKPDVVQVDAQGRICALQMGEAVVTAVSYNGKRAACSVRVRRAPEGVSLSRSELLLGVGEKFTLNAVLSGDSAGRCAFSVGDGRIASVDSSSGAIKALAPGETTVSVETYNGFTASCALVVRAAPTGVAFQEKSITVLVGDRYHLLPPVLSGAGAGCGQLSYKSASTKYMKVDANGWVTGVRRGKVRLTVSTYNGKKANIWVYVKDAPKSIAFASGEVQLMVDEACTPELVASSGAAYSYTLSSSNEAVARIENGRSVRAVGGGNAVITATSFNGKTATLKLKVWALPTEVRLRPAALTLGAGDGAKLRTVLPEGQASTFTYFSSDSSVAAVDASGAVRALQSGSATITVRTQNGLESSCAVRVLRAPSRISLSPSRVETGLDEGGFQLSVALGSAEEGGSYTFASSDESVATVSADGYVTLRGVGAARITVTSYNHCSASCAINVGEKPTGMRFARTEYAVALGDSVCIAPEYEGGSESYRLESSNPSVFAVSGTQVRALGMGSATLTATSRSGLKAQCRLVTEAAPTGIRLEPMQATLVVGVNSTLQLSAAALPYGVGSIRFTSSDPGVAAVDYESGLVTAVSSGDCMITAVTYDGEYGASCTLHVSKLLEGVKIGIDPGHQAQEDPSKESSSPKGGSSKAKVSSGTRGRSTKIKEHVTNLQVGLKLRDALEALGAEVYMTRETADVNISNKQRALMMNEKNVDLVLRLHCNSAKSSGTQGVDLYIRKSCAYSADVVDGKALMAAESSAAKAIFEEYVKATGCKKRAIRKSNEYTGNNWSTVPCILMEMGFSSNPAEDRKMNDPAYQARMVQGMVNGICVYMGRELPAQ